MGRGRDIAAAGRQKGAADRIRQCHPQGTADLPGRLQGSFGLLGCGQQGAGIGQKGLSGIGQADRFAHPVEERRFQFGFQLGHLRGDCDWEYPSSRAAREKLCSSAICKKVLMVRSSTAAPLSGG